MNVRGIHRHVLVPRRAARPSFPPTAGRPLPARPAFTLIEMLVVIGILAILATIVGVVATRARTGATKFQLAAQLQAISVGLDAYKTDHGSYPVTQLEDSIRTSTGTTTADDQINAAGLRGARTLCKALIGATPQGTISVNNVTTPPTYTLDPPSTTNYRDGADGPGFRVPPRSGVFQFNTGSTPVSLTGRVYGPYLSGSQLKFAKTDASGVANPDDKSYDDTTVLLDANDKPILYYPALNPQATISIPGIYAAGGDPTGPTDVALLTTPMYRATDNSAASLLSVAAFRRALGDTVGATVGSPADGAINAGSTTTERPAVRGNYILWTAGPDGVFGPNPNAKNPGEVDDVTNIPE